MSQSDIDSLFKELSFKLHPDTSNYDSNNDFIQLKAEYEEIKVIKNNWNELESYFEKKYLPHIQSLMNKLGDLNRNEPIQSFNYENLLSDSLAFLKNANLLIENANDGYKRVKKVGKKVGLF